MSYNSISLKEKMLIKIANSSEAHIKHLQVDEEDLALSEKYIILEKLLNDKPSIFLERYHSYLDIQDALLFKNYKNLSIVEFYIKLIEINEREKQCPKIYKSKCRNKHYNILQQLIEDGEYFSDGEMQKRDPYLYEQMIGQFLDNDEIAQQAKSASHCSLSANLLNQLQSLQNSQLYEKQLANEKEIIEEYESDDSDNILDRENMSAEHVDDKKLLRKEFTAIMHQRFLDGQDDFNYDDLKYDQDLEPLEIMSRDKEDAYFDKDDDNSDEFDGCGVDILDDCQSYEDDIYIQNDIIDGEFKN